MGKRGFQQRGVTFSRMHEAEELVASLDLNVGLVLSIQRLHTLR